MSIEIRPIDDPMPAQDQRYAEVFTRRWVVDTLLDLTGYTVDRDLGSLTLIEPSSGSGAFVVPAVERLLRSAARHGRDAYALRDAVRAWELQPQHAEACRRRLLSLLLRHDVAESIARSLACSWVVEGDFLLPDDDLLCSGSGQVSADVVVGNPPYIRLEDLPPPLTAAYRRLWPTMVGRADIYVGFIERALRVLKPGGRVGFICADRWMRNQYGDSLRRFVATVPH